MWTTSYPVPINSRNTDKDDSFSATVNIGKDIWIITDTYYVDRVKYVMNIWVFNTETTQYRKIEFSKPEIYGDYVISIKNVDDQIYIWRAEGEENMLFRLDTNTSTLSYVLTIHVETHEVVKVCEVIGNLMYVLEYENEESGNVLYLHTINLDTNKVRARKQLKYLVNTTYIQLIANKKDLYLFEGISNKDRIMYKINDGKLEVVSKDQLDDGKNGLIQKSSLSDRGILYEDKNGMNPIVYQDTFDYKTCKWTRSLAVQPYDPSDMPRMRGCCHINNNIYMLMDQSYTEEVTYDIRVFEKVPGLESSCLMKVVNEYMKNGDIEMLISVKQLLPRTMKMQLDNMIRWRMDEKHINGK